jgi:hypothetical protein
MRWHSFIFAMRSILAMYVIWFQQNGFIPLQYDLLARGSLVIGTMLCADAVTKWYSVDTTTMRNNPYPDYVPDYVRKYLNLFYSMSQIFATFAILYRGYDLIFLTLIPIQLAPFMMTMVKKGLIRQIGWHIGYIVQLLIGYFYAYQHMVHNSPVIPLAIGAAILRFGVGLNKYVLWGFVIGVHYLCNGGFFDPTYLKSTHK